jgi:hypothetical protein
MIKRKKIEDPLTQHFEKSVVVHVLADVVEVVVLACTTKLRKFSSSERIMYKTYLLHGCTFGCLQRV